MNGFSITICFGKYAGFYAKTDSWITRICLGWMAIAIYWRTDLEEFIEHLKNRE